MILYATAAGHIGLLVDYSGRRMHTKYSTICVSTGLFVDYQVPRGYVTPGVAVSSAILQRILREYKSLTKRVLLTGNASYIHIAADHRY